MKLPSLTKKLTTVIICLLPFIRGNTQQNIQNRYVKTGPVYFVNVEGKSAMLSVFVLKQENKSICSIRLYDLQNANILQQKEITR